MKKKGRVQVTARVEGKRVEESTRRPWTSIASVVLLAGIAGYINSAHVSRYLGAHHVHIRRVLVFFAMIVLFQPL